MSISQVQNNSIKLEKMSLVDADIKIHNIKNSHSSTLQSMRKSTFRMGDIIGQFLETAALLALLPFLVFTFFIASTSFLLLPVFVFLFPLLIINDLLWEMLHAILPCFFPHPGHRGIYY